MSIEVSASGRLWSKKLPTSNFKVHGMLVPFESGYPHCSMQKKKKCKKAQWLSEEVLQIAVKRSVKQRRKGKIYPLECRIPKNRKER